MARATETTPLRGEQYASDALKRKRIIGITGAVVVIAAIIVILWLTLSGHSSKSPKAEVQATPEPTPALRTEAPVITELPTEAPTEAPPQAPTEAPAEPATEAPAEPDTDAPAQPPAEPDTEAPAQPPAEAPEHATAAAPADGKT
ncbi:Zinc ion binding protein, partial [Phytophthora palmivora]